jgi:hypothetical protein
MQKGLRTGLSACRPGICLLGTKFLESDDAADLVD